MEVRETMRTWKQKQSQETEDHVTPTTKWTTCKDRQGKHECLPTTLPPRIQQPPHRLT